MFHTIAKTLRKTVSFLSGTPSMREHTPRAMPSAPHPSQVDPTPFPLSRPRPRPTPTPPVDEPLPAAALQGITIAVDSDDVTALDDLVAAPPPKADSPTPVNQTPSPLVVREKSSHNSRFHAIRRLFEAGVIEKGQVIHMPGRPDRAAHILDGRTVEYRGEVMSYTRWGKLVTGHMAVNISRDAIILGVGPLAELQKS